MSTIVMSVGGVLILPTTNSIFKLMQDVGNFNFLYFIQNQDYINTG